MLITLLESGENCADLWQRNAIWQFGKLENRATAVADKNASVQLHRCFVEVALAWSSKF